MIAFLPESMQPELIRPIFSDRRTAQHHQAAEQVVQQEAHRGRLQLAGSVYMSLVRKDYKPKPIAIDPYLLVEGVDGATPYGGDPEAQLDGQ